MTEDHPDPLLLERFMRNETGSEESRRIVRHLLAGCERCTAVTRRLWSLGDVEGPGEDPAMASGSRRLARLVHSAW
jgi:hypothetical protein